MSSTMPEAPATRVDTPISTSGGSTRVRRRLSTSQRLITLAFFLAGAGLHLWRVWDRLTHPGIWAEDASIFYLQDQTRGLGAIFSEYAGYLHLICRIPAAIVGPFGLPAFPAAFAWIGAITGILCFAVVLSPRLNGILPSVWGRGLAFLALCAIPAMQENGANVLNLIFVGGVAILLLGLAQQPVTGLGRGVEISALVLLGLSGPLIAFLSPLFAWRWVRQRSRYNLLVCGVVAITAATQLLVYLGSERVAGESGTVRDGARLYLQRVSGEWLMSGDGALESWDSGGSIVPMSIGFVAIVAAASVWFFGVRALLALGITVGTSVAAGLTYGWVMQYPWSGDRHLVVPMAALIVLAVGAADRGTRAVRNQRGARRITSVGLGGLAAIAVVFSLGGITTHFEVPRYDYLTPESDLEAFQQCLDDGRTDCQIAIAPPSYVLNLKWK